MRRTQRLPTPTAALALALAVAACGGGKKGDTTTPGGGGGDDQVAAQGGGGGAAVALPAIPSSPAPAPAALMATVSIGDPKGQIDQIGAYVDAIQPGMGAMVGQLLPQMAAAAGAPSL